MAVNPTQALIDKVFEESYRDKYTTQADVADAAMDDLDDLLEGYGVEALHEERAWVNSYYGDIIAFYVNMGDTYDTTVVYDTDTEEAHVGSLGDFYENWLAENQPEEEW